MSSKETLTVAPTRMNLLDLRNRKKLAENGYNLLKEKRDALIIELYAAENTSIALDDTIVAFREYLNSAINVAEKIAALQKLAYEIASVNRRVNALEQIVIPRFENTIIKIDQALEEDERESFTRMKMVKAKLLNKEDEN